MGESIKRIVGPYQDSYSPNGIIGEKDACGVGFVANVKGIESNWILKQSLKGLNCMEHRGGCGGDSDSGDGAGILCSIPWNFLEKKLNLQNRIHLINRFVSDSELPNIFCSADCLILPYKQASQSGVVATSTHYNTPIIATDTGDLRSSIVEGKTGALVEPNNPSLLAEKIQNWLMQDNNISQVQIEYDKIRQAKSWDAFASQLFS